MKEKLLLEFEQVFDNTNDVRIFFAPGRVNLIGEHTDYNGGHVFPCALTIGTYAAARKNGSNCLRFFSMNFRELGIITVALDQLVYDKAKNFANYPAGVINALKNHGYEITEGMDVLYYGDIPNGSGLSSSASLEVLTAYVVRELFHFSYSFLDMAKYSKEAENEFVGVNCGIMDQFACAMGKAGNAMFLDTNTLEYEYAPIHLEGMKIVIANTNKKRGLGDSKYNQRRAECEQALKLIQTKVDITSLGELSEAQFEAVKDVIEDEEIRRRAKHAVYENQRTIQAVKALKENNIGLFGHLMNESHISLRDDYEVTGEELDTLVLAAWEQNGVVGARMTGAGFGGCTVSIVEDEKVKEFIENVEGIYKEKIGYAASFYIVEVGDGPRTIL